MIKVVMNEQHRLMEEQEEILKNEFGEFDMILVPKEGWSVDQIEGHAQSLLGETVVFVSPVPLMIQRLAFYEGYAHNDNCNMANAPLYGMNTKVLIFHNDKRVKKELNDGRIIQTVAETGWELV